MQTVSAKLTKQWQALHGELASQTGERTLAGLFLGYCPPDFAASKQRVLYVGKATRGSFHEADAAEVAYKKVSSQFWYFRTALNDLLGASGVTVSIAWSNVCKIGVQSGNPSESLQLAQQALAAITLREEITSLSPTLVVFTSANYADDIVYQALGVVRGEDGFETHPAVDGTEFYSRAVTSDCKTPILWIPHPERKRNELKTQWLQKVQELFG